MIMPGGGELKGGSGCSSGMVCVCVCMRVSHSVSPHCSCEAREPGAHIDAQA